MNREEAMGLIQEKVENINLIRHMLATEAVLRALARRLGEDEEKWGLTGLLHDVDMELTGANLDTHSRVGAKLLRDMGLPEEVAHAVLCHNPAHHILPESRLDKALYAADPITGLITAVALVRPDKKLAQVEVRSVKKKFKEKGFAAGVNREQIETCRELGLALDDFIALSLEAMKGIASDIGL